MNNKPYVELTLIDGFKKESRVWYNWETGEKAGIQLTRDELRSMLKSMFDPYRKINEKRIIQV